MPSFRFIWASLFSPSRDSGVKAQAVRQIFSGAIATGADLLVFQSAIRLGFHPSLAAVFSFVVVASTNFTITRFYVIGETRVQTKPLAAQYPLYIATALVSLAIIQLFILVFYVYAGLAPILARIIAIPFVFIFTLLVGRLLVFKKAERNGVSHERDSH
ncbi:MAG: GtrA family protein [Deltaproteobacteria bacterium]|nr:GtrA family protein [Deltaproteobacteria bacterium]